MPPQCIPALFAVFDCSPDWPTPFYKNRYALLRRVSEPDAPLRVEPHLLPEQGALNINQSNITSLIHSVQVAGTPVRQTLWWFTGDSLWYDNHHFPVLDFQDRSAIPFLFDTTATNDDVSWCIVRQIAQRRLRDGVEDRALEARVARLPPVPLAATAATKNLPQFVLRALLRDAETQSQTCPITQQKPAECGEVLFTSCYHWFEKTALETWLGSSSDCPTCKAHVSFTVPVTPGQ